MKYVYSYLTHAYDPQHGVHIGAVGIHQSTFVVYNFCNLPDIFFEKAESIGIGDHNAGRFIIHERRNGIGGKNSSVIGFHIDGAVAAQCYTGRVRAMCGVRNNDFGTP